MTSKLLIPNQTVIIFKIQYSIYDKVLHYNQYLRNANAKMLIILVGISSMYSIKISVSIIHCSYSNHGG